MAENDFEGSDGGPLPKRAEVNDDILGVLDAGWKFRETLKPDGGGPHAPWWHGWAIMDAFKAGAEFAEKRVAVRREACTCPEPGCEHDEVRFALMRIAKAIVNAHDYGGSPSWICRAVTDNITEMRRIVDGK